MVRISAIALDTLLELVGRQVIQELGEDSLSGVHPSLLTIGAASGHPALAPGSAAVNFKSKNVSYTLSHVICNRYGERPDFSRTLLFGLLGDRPVEHSTTIASLLERTISWYGQFPHHPGKGWLTEKALSLLPDISGNRLRTRFGVIFECDLRDKLSRELYYYGFDTFDCRALRKLITPGSIVIDAGANIGY